MEERLLKPADIPLIITSATSSPETSRKFEYQPPEDVPTDNPPKQQQNRRKRSVEGKNRTTGGSLKYEIGRNGSSSSNLIDLPMKWSSVRIKGTGFHDSRRSIVKIEPCNGIPGNTSLCNKEYQNLKSPSAAAGHNMKPYIGNVSTKVGSFGL